jgi:hypothetical protein
MSDKFTDAEAAAYVDKMSFHALTKWTLLLAESKDPAESLGSATARWFVSLSDGEMHFVGLMLDECAKIRGQHDADHSSGT